MTAATGLEWRPVGRNQLIATATGVRGWYRLKHTGLQWLLVAYGWDGAPTMMLPPEGRLYDTRCDAEKAATRIETAPYVGEMSGS